MRFNFTGKLMINGLEKKNPYLRTGKTKSGVNYKTFSCGVASATNNIGWTELFGMDNDVIKTIDNENNKIEVAKNDRFDQDVVESVASYRKNVVKIGTDRNVFISPYDTVEFLAENIDEFKDKNVTITGTTSLNLYNGNISQRFQIQNIYLAEDDAKCQLKCTDTFFFTKDSFDDSEWREEKKLYINGWISAYIDKDAGNKYVPQQLVFDCSKVNFDNEKHVKLVNFKLSQIGCGLDENNKIKCKLKNSVYKIAVIMSYQNGAEEVEFDESTLTDNQKEAIELGIKTLDDFRPSGSLYGNRVTVFKLTDFDLRGDYEDGYVDTDMKISEFEEDVFIPTKEEKVEDIMNAPVEEKKVETVADDDDLFS